MRFEDAGQGGCGGGGSGGTGVSESEGGSAENSVGDYEDRAGGRVETEAVAETVVGKW